MTYRIPPLIDALKKYMGWFPAGHKPESGYAPAGLSGGSAAGTHLAFSHLASPRPLDIFLCCLLAFIFISYARSPKRKLPPHPRRTPIIGNLSQLNDKSGYFPESARNNLVSIHRDLGRMLM
jgi:hypothetical protein